MRLSEKIEKKITNTVHSDNFKTIMDFLFSLLFWIVCYQICLGFFETKNITAVLVAFFCCYVLKWFCLFIINRYKK